MRLQKLKLSLLGAPHIYLDEEDITAQFAVREQALLFYLAMSEQTHQRSAVASLLWDTGSDAQAMKNLRDVLPNLRKQLGAHLVITHHTVGFNRDSLYWFDTTALQQTVQAATDSKAEQLNSALMLYRGEFLEGFHVRDAPAFEEWLLAQRQYWQDLVVQGWEQLVHSYVEQNETTLGLRAVKALLKLEPWRETTHQQYMRLLARGGQRSAALAQFAVCQRILAAELDVTPSAETIALYEQIKAGKLSSKEAIEINGFGEPALGQGVQLAVPTPQPTLSPLHNLPRHLTPLIGRQMEGTLLQNKVLDARYPLITLSGEGGIGKTRLALAVAETVCQHFPDGVWFIALARITPEADLPDQFAAVIGEALGLAFTGSDALVDQLFTYLRSKQLLLILDNFEHLLAGAEFILEILQAARGVKVLVTSRRRLNFQGEYLFRLDGLAVAEEAESQGEEDALGQALWPFYDSEALFVERAERILKQFPLTLENRRAVRQICRLVEGLPLGIELAATLLRRMSCPEIVEALRQSFAVLATTLRDLPARHRNIQAVMISSWHMLTPTEARVLMQCSVFHGGFTLAAAHAIAQATPEVLTMLEDHSLLRQIVPGRFEMHALVHQYAIEQLQKEQRLMGQVYDRHSAYYAEFLAEREQSQNQDRTAQALIRAELDNIRAAWSWAIQQGDMAVLARSLKSLSRFYYLAGFLSEAIHTLTPAIARVRQLLTDDAQPIPPLQQLLAQLLLEIAFFDSRLNREKLAEKRIQEALVLAETLGEPGLAALGHLRSGDLAWLHADYMRHRQAYIVSLALVRQSQIPALEAHCLSNLGMSHDQFNEYAEAIQCYETALTIAQQLENRQQENIIYNNLGVSNGRLGNFGLALHYHQQAQQLSRELGDQEGLGFAQLNQGILWSALGHEAHAQTALEQALTIFRAMKLIRLEAKTLTAFARLYEQSGNYALAHQACEQALALANAGGYQNIKAIAQTTLGYILTAECALPAALATYEAAGPLWRTLGQTQGRLLTEAGLAQLLMRQNQLTDAWAIIDQMWEPLAQLALNALEQPGRIFLIAYRVFNANSDARAEELRQRGCALLQSQAATLASPSLQHSFLHNVVFHRELMAEQTLCCA